MASKIRVLDEQTINKIAAGEVIENPASVIKELVENSLDAGSTEITIEIRGGGRQMIRISDNGCGMDADDALLCLERHATSKIRDVDDIFSVGTMGFRGEAIPSIASISKFTLLTCTHDPGAMGTMVNIEGGRIASVAPAVRAPGTTIEVKSLFFNVPVRMKFQRSPTYDANEITKVVSMIALGNPYVRIELINNGSVVLSATPNEENSLEERIRTVLGGDFVEQCCSVVADRGEMSLRGVIGLPANTKSNRTGQYLFINRRPVVSPLVSYAVREAYGTMLSTTRHPVYVLYLTIPGDLVDVNVHPQKREVRLRQDEELRRFIIQSVDKALHETGVSSFVVSHELPSFVLPPTVPQFAGFPVESEPFFIKPATPYVTPSAPVRHVEEKSEPELFKETLSELPVPKVLATIPRYLLIEKEGGGVSLVDQRAAHARVIFEKFQKGQEGKGVAVQQLLIPHQLETTPLEAMALRDQIPVLEALGIAIKEFGENSFLIEGLPAVFGNIDVAAFVADVVHAVHQERGESAFQKELEKRIALAASRVAMPSSRRLAIDEAKALMQQLMKCEKPYQCPLGKPTIVHMSESDLTKQFTRG